MNTVITRQDRHPTDLAPSEKVPPVRLNAIIQQEKKVVWHKMNLLFMALISSSLHKFGILFPSQSRYVSPCAWCRTTSVQRRHFPGTGKPLTKGSKNALPISYGTL